MKGWNEYKKASIHKMLNPQSVAVIGATPRMQYGGKFLKRLLSYKDRVRVYAVNPKYDEIMDHPCYSSVDALPEAPDLAVVIVPYHAVLDTLKQCREKGTQSAIVISAGFAERGDEARRALQVEVGNYCREAGIHITGPKCLGLANVRDDLWLTSSGRVDSGTPGAIGLVCQSGASLFGPFLARAIDYGIGLSYAVSTGNEADLEFADIARYLLEDPGTKVVAGFIEGFKDAQKFVDVAKFAAKVGKPIVLIKIGRSELGARAAGSHTAALTGSDTLYDAVCKQYGVIRVQNYDDLLEVSQLLAHHVPTQAKGIAVVSHSGGVSSLTADMLGQAGLTLPELTQSARDGINAILGDFGAASNPADVTGKANSDEFPAIMHHLLDQPEVGTLVVASAGRDQHAEQVIAIRNEGKKNIAYMWTGSRTQPTGLPLLKAAGIPIVNNPDSLARGLKHVQDYHAWRNNWLQNAEAIVPKISAVQLNALAQLQGLERSSLSEAESKRLISQWHIPVAREILASTADAAVAAAESIGYPVVMKIDSPDILHKTEVGGVRLGLQSAEEVSNAFEAIVAKVRGYMPAAKVSGVSIQEMVRGGVEMIAGISYDDQLGPTLLVGTGGVMVEVYKDVTMRQCPVSHQEARNMLSEIKGSQLLAGFRGAPEADIDALIEALVNLSYLAVQLEETICELDINPLLVLPKGKGVKAVDALVNFHESSFVAV